MDWSPQQVTAIRGIREWLADQTTSEKICKVDGFAGTGKTTLIKEAVAGYRAEYCAYTGKAASVLQKKGCDGASTIHRLIFLPSQRSKHLLKQLQERIHQLNVQLKTASSESEKNLRRQLKDLQEALRREERHLTQPAWTINPDSRVVDADVVVVDEASMVGEYIGQALESFDKKILVIGDPFQLPPVREKGGEGYFTRMKHNFLLTEVHRQARDSVVLRLATDIREGRNIRLGEYNDGCAVITAERLKSEPTLVTQADQVLCGKNETRHTGNWRVREMLGFVHDKGDWFPKPNERLVCLRNDSNVGVLNGTLWDVLAASIQSSEVIDLHVRDAEGDAEVLCDAFATYMRDGEKARKFTKEERREYDAQDFDYGYLLTVHKAQGSQWDHVLVLDQSRTFNRDGNGRRWLYTAITRAAKSVVIAKMDSVA